jgi:SAM-dependent methyltransferase
VTDEVSLHDNRKRAGSFGDDAEQYDRVRPPYPSEMVDLLTEDHPRDVLDVGCGTGIASRLFMARGCRVLGVEPDSRMAVVARRRGVEVEEGAIEQWDARGRLFDLLVAGQAWHWVEPHQGAVRASEVLRPGGRIGLFWNQSFPVDGVLDDIMAEYARHAPELGRESVLLGQRHDAMYEGIASALRANGGLSDVDLRTFGHDVSYSTDEWLELASTHSDHRTLPADQLSALLDGLRVAIDRSGGRIQVHYVTTLVSGLRRSGSAD